MTAWDENVIKKVNNLIETCKDGEDGFRQAAEAIDTPHIKNLFLEYADERRGFASALQSEARRAGEDPERSGSVAGALHRGWIEVKSALTGKSEQAVISAAETGEDSAVRAYEEALEDPDLPPDLRVLVERQHRRVADVHDSIRALRDRASAA